MSEPEALPDRRKPDPQIEFLTSILHTVQKLNEKFETMNGVRSEITEIKHTLLDHIKDEAAICQSAFPDGDPDGHRRMHEAEIKRKEAEAEVWLAAKKKIIEMTVIGLISGFSILIVFYWKGNVAVPPIVEQVLPRLGGK